MATIVNNPNGSSDGVAGWVIAAALIVVIALIALFVWPGYAATDADGTDTDTVQYVPVDTDEDDTTPPPILNTTINATTTNNYSTTTNE